MKKKHSIISVFLFALNGLLLGQAGILDGDFDGDGKLTTLLGSSSEGNCSIQQPDGKIIMAGYAHDGNHPNFGMVRYFPDGSLDTGFGTDGIVTTEMSTSGSAINDLALQDDGKILAVGYTYNSTKQDIGLARYNPDGTLDNTFSYDGKVTTTITAATDNGYKILLQPDSKILVAGHGTDTYNLFALVRYNSDGTLDNDFGTNGKVTTVVGSSHSCIQSIVLQSDGKIVAAGYSTNASEHNFAFMRYNSDGTVDDTFAANGSYTDIEGIASDLIILSDGKIMVTGSFYEEMMDEYNFCMLKLSADGETDNTFGFDGYVATDFDYENDFPVAIKQQSDNKLVVAGTAIIDSKKNFAVVRYNTNGDPDSTFGTYGKAYCNFSDNNDDVNDMLIQDDGKIVVSGSTKISSNTTFAAARFISGVTVGIPENTENDQSFVYPALANDKIFIDIPNQAEFKNIELTIIDISGQVISRQAIISDKTEINIRDLSDGIYLVHLTTDGSQSVSKFVKR